MDSEARGNRRAHLQAKRGRAVVPAMKPHVRRGRAAKEKRIERARARRASQQKRAA